MWIFIYLECNYWKDPFILDMLSLSAVHEGEFPDLFGCTKSPPHAHTRTILVAGTKLKYLQCKMCKYLKSFSANVFGIDIQISARYWISRLISPRHRAIDVAGGTKCPIPGVIFRDSRVMKRDEKERERERERQ